MGTKTETAAQAGAATESTATETVAVEEAPKHPAHRLLDEAAEKLNTLGSYAVSQIQPLLDEIRGTL